MYIILNFTFLVLTRFLSWDTTSLFFQNLANLQCNVTYDKIDCYHTHNRFLENYLYKIANSRNSIDKNIPVKDIQNTISQLCGYSSSKIAFIGYVSNIEYNEICKYEETLNLVNDIHKINSKKIVPNKISIQKENLRKVEYLLEYFSIEDNLLLSRFEIKKNPLDLDYRETLRYSLRTAKKIRGNLTIFLSNPYLLRTSTSFVNELINLHSGIPIEFLLGYEDIYQTKVKQNLQKCDSNCEHFDKKTLIENLKPQESSNAWLQYSEQFCSLLTASPSDKVNSDYVKSCLYTKLNQFDKFESELKVHNNYEEYDYAINNLHLIINNDTNYLMKENRDWTKPLNIAFKEFSSKYCQNNDRNCMNIIQFIHLKDLIEIHAYQSKLIFKDLGIEPIESGLD
ncbi:hypothetical protein [Taylorella equigenitalis]|uniref:hypothetical protein n=1 Tax=Taylorella equigenitalis TaxID=29575 RepID=UPI0003FCFA9E|nr:hypothetical protein [Taylorella equigenitalis]ASY38025.1 hypothetical protein CA605_04905 [Taylorella equigenitalis]ASY42445.1 hypothetical protein CA943_04900 [Taylorella equigenitalis]KGK34011.1 hypothetical protein LW90_00130 [Taylorella equigenitalis]RBA26814.1 hypothetical protein DQW13_03935 [Taylorella equigenitalis]